MVNDMCKGHIMEKYRYFIQFSVKYVFCLTKSLSKWQTTVQVKIVEHYGDMFAINIKNSTNDELPLASSKYFCLRIIVLLYLMKLNKVYSSHNLLKCVLQILTLAWTLGKSRYDNVLTWFTFLYWFPMSVVVFAFMVIWESYWRIRSHKVIRKDPEVYTKPILYQCTYISPRGRQFTTMLSHL